MIDATNLSVDNKAVKWMFFNGSIVYSTSIDSSPVSWALENTTLSAGGILSANTYTPPGDTSAYTCSIYSTPSQQWFAGGSGSNHLFPVSRHVFARAAHYGSTLTGAIAGNTTQLSLGVTEVTLLTDWAKSNGFAAAWVDSLGIGDIQMVMTSGDPITANCYTEDDIPYYIDEMTFKGMFHRDNFKGLCGYCGTQLTGTGNDESGKGQPIIFTNDISSGTTKGELQWSTPPMLNNLIPTGEQYDYIRQMGATYLGTTGDSGKPIYITIGGGKNIVVSHNHQIVKPAFSPTAPYFMSGPNYTKAFPLLKAYVESKGDTIKTLEG